MKWCNEVPLKKWLFEIRLEKLEKKRRDMKDKIKKFIPLIFSALLAPQFASASFEGMLNNVQTVLLNVVAPAICIGGVVLSATKLANGDESAKGKLIWSCLGAVACFSAPSIVQYMQNRVAG